MDDVLHALKNGVVVRILTYNTKMMPFDKTADERAPKIIEHIQSGNYDIVCLQELFSDAKRSEIQDGLANASDLDEQAEGVGSDWLTGHFVGSGLAILTRFEIETQSTIEFDGHVQLGMDAIATKGALHVLLKINNSKKLHVFTAHTQSGDDTQRRITRWIQLQHLAEFVRQETEGDEWPVVLVGDLNVNAKEESSYKHLLSTFENELRGQRIVNDAGNRETTFPTTGESLDYVLLFEKEKRIKFETKVLRGWGTSDHDPVLTIIKV